MKRKNLIRKTGIYILLIFVLFISLFPIVYPVFASFRTDQELFANMTPFNWYTIIPKEWTFDNYIAIFQEYGFAKYLRNTMLMILLIVPGTIVICSLAAFAFSFYEFRFKKQLFSLFLVTFMIPGEAIALPLYSLVNSMGLVNTYAGLVLPAMANGLVLFLLVQFFSDTPKALLESVEIDGGGWWMTFTKIVLPLSKPIIITAGLMIFVNQWNDYLWPLLVARSDDIKVVTLAVSNFREESVIHWGYIYAASVISAMIPIALFLPFQKYFVQGITSGGVKG